MTDLPTSAGAKLAWHIPGCDRLDGHDGRDPGACMQGGRVITQGTVVGTPVTGSAPKFANDQRVLLHYPGPADPEPVTVIRSRNVIGWGRRYLVALPTGRLPVGHGGSAWVSEDRLEALEDTDGE